MSKYISLLRNINFIHNNTTKISNISNNITIFNVLRRYCQTQSAKCWNCGVVKNAFDIFCDNCKFIQQPRNKDNYFKVIGINESYDVDLKALRDKYRELQNVLHPDKYSNKTNEEKLISEEYSSIVNTAYNTLQSPINRGLHLLALKGEEINEHDKNDDQQFLLEIMELNEEVEDAETPEQLLNLNKKNRLMLQQLTQELSNVFRLGSTLDAKNVLIRMKYYTSISAQINGILREKGIVE